MIGEVETPARFRNYGRQEAYRKSVQDRFKMEKALRNKLASKLVAPCEKKFAGREFLSKVDVKELLAACDVVKDAGVHPALRQVESLLARLDAELVDEEIHER